MLLKRPRRRLGGTKFLWRRSRGSAQAGGGNPINLLIYNRNNATPQASRFRAPRMPAITDRQVGFRIAALRLRNVFGR